MEPILNADLHCHSVVSDGTLTPEVLAARAKANGVQLWALTDHDEIGGQARAMAAAKALELPYLTGTEISITFAGHTVHIVGLGFDHTHPELLQGLRSTRGGRQERAQEMSAGLAQVGTHGGQAVEVVTGSHSSADAVQYAGTALEFGLAASRGSDFHSPDESHTDLGSLPFLPGQLTPVWELLTDRIQ